MAKLTALAGASANACLNEMFSREVKILKCIAEKTMVYMTPMTVDTRKATKLV